MIIRLSCRCCGYLNVGGRLAKLLNALEILRSQVHTPIAIVSGYRCPSHNRAVGGAGGSKHLTGEAADISVEGYAPAQLAQIVKDYCHEVRGIGIGATKCHIDVREGPLVEWKYS